MFGFDEANNCHPGQEKNNRVVVKYLSANFSRKSQRVYTGMEQANPVTMIGISNKMMFDVPDHKWRYNHQTN
ncbi:hypothetical protein GCM10007422_15600 [Pedobacter zeae]|uniref:Uncharacterized protein n=1 Tax=Pedobacter zeae TaxID=1737356 RepID=A0ABQ1XSF1_9SPHI|nr:hypothetical protein GCM10007422_15600 [Pedobacter zeae]